MPRSEDGSGRGEATSDKLVLVPRAQGGGWGRDRVHWKQHLQSPGATREASSGRCCADLKSESQSYAEVASRGVALIHSLYFEAHVVNWALGTSCEQHPPPRASS